MKKGEMLSDDDPLLKRSAARPQDACPVERAAVIDCRAGLGLKERECYPFNYRGECDDLELRLAFDKWVIDSTTGTVDEDRLDSGETDQVVFDVLL